MKKPQLPNIPLPLFDGTVKKGDTKERMKEVIDKMESGKIYESDH